MIERADRSWGPMSPEISIPVPPPRETRFHATLSGVARWSSVLATLLVVGVIVGEVDEAAVLAATPLVLGDRTALLFRVLVRR
ncbi:hypothetical protein [Streptomyces roseus]|uniref:hypothetical protein n=1 Tax=Streptomyces roseus TaxID=66430 RepID=UPI000A56B9ED|nr:hypothetical protein [Streptomyces roseus]